ncbi:Uncharacterized conserved protein YkwD, contains CAP (CSP/antigen 5/PR1) domain [Cognatiyoonia koreensis]|uniref:Uncharacterized conserved protein YkwD, contains CAP (CSP/antigen 5/PR1) domain n=1 Tax=Cognatiyoonia koreensis TaxID=364200 RepID=A0A1I0QE65_9RHOB|nr:CAP domain-containing protein [Cognatiyoonia koreensis]SEW25178.1 Uncharacterized conserved protein YkwD, contains CAP (CSP/antigen 5/PR1) domain [Cognatiyoonia koreensis]
MNRLKSICIAIGLSVLAGQATAARNCATPANVNVMAQEIANGINANRRANGQPAIRYNQRLSQAAMTHACDMAANGFFGHNGSNGSDVNRRVRNAGYQGCLVAENLAWGYPSSQQIISGWMQSPGHRSNMLHPRVAEFGVGITQGPRGPNWVLVLAKGC